MSEPKQQIFKSILENMHDGVISIDLNGVITTFNPAAEAILEIDREQALKQNFALFFMSYPENDDFNQTVLDAIYESSVSHNRVVAFQTGCRLKTLALTTSFMKAAATADDDSVDEIGVIAVFSDITEMESLRDALKAMEAIKKLNQKLELRNKFIREIFGRYISDEVVASLIETPDGLTLGGEKRTLSILMSDLRGFTAMSTRLKPEQTITLLNHYLGAMTHIIMRYGGTIVEFIGDAIFVLFGAPKEMADHALKAVACAIEMQSAMAAVNQWNLTQQLPCLEMGIGINTGPVIVGNIGSEERTKYGVVGEPVNLAARVESYTVGGQVLVTADTAEAVGASLQTGTTQTVEPKGVSEPITIYSVSSLGGRYNLRLPQTMIEICRLPSPVAIKLFAIQGKDCAQTPLHAEIAHLALNQALIRTSDPIPPMSNYKIMLDNSGEDIEIYAKCQADEETDTTLKTLRFTSVSHRAKKVIAGLIAQAGRK